MIAPIRPDPSRPLPSRDPRGLPSTHAAGSGWTLPLVLEGRPLSGDARPRSLAATARLVLEVVPGERPLEPEFGCRIHFLEDIDGSGGRALAGALVEEALERWVPQLRVDRAVVSVLRGDELEVRLRTGGKWHCLSLRHRRSSLAGREATP